MDESRNAVKRITLCLMVVLAAFAMPGTAQEDTAQGSSERLSDAELDAALKKWGDDYVRYIITDEERAIWKKLKSREEKLRFIEDFWLRRDPTPRTPKNEYREDYIRRWAYVEKTFTAGKPGWRTDRGRIYLMLGPPSSIERNPFGRNRTERPSEVWSYNSINNKVLPAVVEIAFVDFMGYGDYEIVTDLDSTARFNSAFGIAMNNLDAYALRRGGEIRPPEELVMGIFDERRVVHPELLSRDLFDLQRELGEIAKVPGKSVHPLIEEIKTVIARGKLTFGLDVKAFQAEGGLAYLPVTVAVPLNRLSFTEDRLNREYNADIYARIHGAAASDTFEDKLLIKVPLDKSKSDPEAVYLYQFWFSVPPGSYRLNVTLRDTASDNIGHQQREIEVPSFEGGLTLSDIVVADLITEAPANTIARKSEAGAFRISDRRVIPNVSGRIPLDQKQFFVYFHVYNFAGSPEDGTGHLKVVYFIYRNGELFSKTPELSLERNLSERTAVQAHRSPEQLPGVELRDGRLPHRRRRNRRGFRQGCARRMQLQNSSRCRAA